MADERDIQTLVTRERIDARVPRSVAYVPATVIGAYRVLDVLGDGAIGRVYLAEHIKLGKKVALKMLRNEYLAHPAVVKRFFAEARAVGKLAHENIVSITDFFEDEAGKSYYIMEHLEGRTLREAEQEGPIPLARALSIAKQIASGLQAAHDQRIVHRDLKPENVFLVARGDNRDFVKLLDFGVAKLLDARDARLDVDTKVGTLVGSPPYMAPEQTIGAALDHRADIYAFGVLLYELLTGTNPFQAETINQMIELHRTLIAPEPKLRSDVDARARAVLRPLLARCLSKKENDRPQNMHEVIAALSSIDPARRSDRRPLIAFAAALALFAGVAYFLLKPEEKPVVIATIAPPVAPREMVLVAEEVPKSVRLELDSEPRGAEVRRAGGDEVLGVTPFSLELSRSSEAIELEVKKDGFLSAAQIVTPDRNVAVTVTLKEIEKQQTSAKKKARRKPTARPTPSGPSGPIDPSEQKNPFEK